MAFEQENRLLRLSSWPFGSDQVMLTGLSGREAMSRLYSFQIDLASTKLELKAPDVVGQPVTIEIARTGDDESKPPRYINGYISRFSAGDVSGEEDAKTQYREYTAEVVPWLWFLTQTARCYIYFPEKEDKTIFEIIEAVLIRARDELHIGSKVKFDMAGIDKLKSRKVKHCVQYRETDFNFLSRILEQYGAFYYFTQKDGEHQLVLSMKSDYPDAEQNKIRFPSQTSAGRTTVDHINSWEHAYEFTPGRWAHTDYNFESPSARMKSDSGKISAAHKEADKYEIYDFPGEFAVANEGRDESRIRQEEAEVQHNTVQVTSHCRTLMPGHCFELQPREDGSLKSEVGKYMVTSISHHASQPGPESGGSGQMSQYSNSYSCIPADVQFRPSRQTPKPVVSGIQTAVVVGPKGEEIHTDEYGRIMVAFHWDREDEDRPDKEKPRKKVDHGEKFFCWVRVAQNIAGNKWGFMAIPRIGQEVVVDFLEGDPDRPLVVGSVYNAEQMPHYDLPSEKTKTYIKTNSTKGGDGHNELRFEDKMNNEQIYIHAERNMDTRVKHDSMERVIHDRHLIVGNDAEDKVGDQREMVYQDKDLNVKRNHTEHIEGNMQLMIGNGDADEGGTLDVVVENGMKEFIGEDGYDFHLEGDRRVKIDKSDSLTVDGSRATAIGGDENLKLNGGKKQKIDGSYALDVGGSYDEKAGMKHAVEAGQEIHLKAGMKVIIEAGVQVSLVGPGGFVDIGPAGVTIQGIMVKINSGGAAGSGSGASPEAPEAPTEPDDASEASPVVPTMADNSTTGHKSAPD